MPFKLGILCKNQTVVYTVISLFYEKLSYHKGTARRAMSGEILSTAAQLYKNDICKDLQKVNNAEGHSR